MKALLLMFSATALVCQIAFAQTLNPSTDVLVWEYNKLNANGEDIIISGKLITYGSQKMDWSQKDGKYVETYTIVSSNSAGNWTNFAVPGNLQYSATWDLYTGAISFTKNAT